ncbi:TetR/AcrR family transcriptional regulator [Sphingomonas sp.]|uniref:TetR/AcrR family transcriptional regulator n=1 Tax=Sphingomonas sp. TaxID=28214 RepID=UPI0025FE3B8C|nr:TetR/AcrR family transcriptional regulator [Sphingomonas sp.]
MRYEKGRKDETRRRIVEVAADRFRNDGIAASGLAGIMSEVGLTNGAFYPHFQSKAELVRESVAAGMDSQSKLMREIIAAGGIEAAISEYLSPAHRDNPGAGCTLAALLPELARQPLETRKIFAERFMSTVRDFVSDLPGQTEDQEAVAMGLYAILIGTLQLARAVEGIDLSDRILAAGAAAARTIVQTASAEDA